jgi:hypothetical protein
VLGTSPEEELENKIDEASLKFERWRKTTGKIPLNEFKQAIEMWKQETQTSTDLLGKDIPLGADKIAYNLVANRSAFSSVLLWGASLELYAKRLEKELAKAKRKTKKTKGKK